MGERGSGLLMTSPVALNSPGGAAALDGLSEVQLRAMLDTTYNYEERLQIRRAIRHLKKQKAESPNSEKVSAGDSPGRCRKESSTEGRKWSRSNQVGTKSTGNNASSTQHHRSPTTRHCNGELTSVNPPPSQGMSATIAEGENERGESNFTNEQQNTERDKNLENCILNPGKERRLQERRKCNEGKMDDVESQNLKNLVIGKDVSIRLEKDKLSDIIKLESDGKHETEVNNQTENSTVEKIVLKDCNREEKWRVESLGEKSVKETSGEMFEKREGTREEEIVTGEGNVLRIAEVTISDEDGGEESQLSETAEVSKESMNEEGGGTSGVSDAPDGKADKDFLLNDETEEGKKEDDLPVEERGVKELDNSGSRLLDLEDTANRETGYLGEKDCDAGDDGNGKSRTLGTKTGVSRSKKMCLDEGKSIHFTDGVEECGVTIGLREREVSAQVNERDREPNGLEDVTHTSYEEKKIESKEGKFASKDRGTTKYETESNSTERLKGLEVSDNVIKSDRYGLENGSVPQSVADERKSRISSKAGETVDNVDANGNVEKARQEDETEKCGDVRLEDIEDESLLRQMLDSSLDFEERRKIRAAMRALKKKKQSQPVEKKAPVQQSYLNLSNRSWKSGRNSMIPIKTSTPKMKDPESKKQASVLGRSSRVEMDSDSRGRTTSKPIASKLPKSQPIARESISGAKFRTDRRMEEAQSRLSDEMGKNEEEKFNEVFEVEASSDDKSSLESTAKVGESSKMDKSTETHLSESRKMEDDKIDWKDPSSTVEVSDSGRAASVECTLGTDTEGIDQAKRRRREWQTNLLRSYEESGCGGIDKNSSKTEGRKKEMAKSTEGDTEEITRRKENKPELSSEENLPTTDDSKEGNHESSVKEGKIGSRYDSSEVAINGEISIVESSEERRADGSPQVCGDDSLSVTTFSEFELSKNSSSGEGEPVSELEDKSLPTNRESEIMSEDASSNSDKSFKITTDGGCGESDLISPSEEDVSDNSCEVVDSSKGEDEVGGDQLQRQETALKPSSSPDKSLAHVTTSPERTPLSHLTFSDSRNVEKTDRERFVSSRWREPKKANFKDIQSQFQSGFKTKNQDRKIDKALLGVRGKVSQAALRFSSPDATQPSPSKATGRGTLGSPGRTGDRDISDCKMGSISKSAEEPETPASDSNKNKRETRDGLREDVSVDKEAGNDRVLEEESPSKSIYMTPVGTPASPDTFFTPKETTDTDGSGGEPSRETSVPGLGTSPSLRESRGDEGLLHSKRVKTVEGDQQKKRTRVDEDSVSAEIPVAAALDPDTTMAPTVEQITDETTLEKMLEEATIFEERKKIRARLRELRKQKRGGGGGGGETVTPTPQEVMDTGDNTEATSFTERKRTRASALTVNTSSSEKSGGSTTTTIGVKPSGTTTALSPVSPAAKTVKTDSDHTTNVVTHDDGKTKSMTTTSVKTGPGMKSTQVTTMTKTDDGAGTKGASMKQETTTTKTETSGDGSKSFFSKTTTTSVSSSSSSTDKPAAGKPQSKFQQELEEKKKKRAEQQKIDQDKWKADQEARRKAAYEKRKKEEEEAKVKKASLMDKFGGKASSVGPVGPRKTVAGGSTRMMAQNPATIKAKLLEWSQRCSKGYPNVNISNFSSSWCDGMAFCALVHSYYPDAFDFNTLDPKNRRHNFDLAFNTAEKLADIYPLLETDDMLMMKDKPDWKCVFTYVQALYRGLHKAAGQVPA